MDGPREIADGFGDDVSIALGDGGKTVVFRGCGYAKSNCRRATAESIGCSIGGDDAILVCFRQFGTTATLLCFRCGPGGITLAAEVSN